MKCDYFYKAQILETRLPYYERKISKLEFQIEQAVYGSKEHPVEEITEEIERAVKVYQSEIEDYNAQMKAEYGFDFNESETLREETHKINKAYYQRVKRLKDKVEGMLNNKCIFLTITFKDPYIDTLSYQTKRKYVQRMLTKLGCPYVANIDYGKKNERLHYHALVQIDRIDNKNNKLWQYGNLDFKRVVVPNYKAISKYICKLTNHAIKETTKGNRLLYDRK